MLHISATTFYSDATPCLLKASGVTAKAKDSQSSYCMSVSLCKFMRPKGKNIISMKL